MSARTRRVMVKLSIKQHDLIEACAKRFRCSSGEMLLASAMSGIEGWEPSPEFTDTMLNALADFVDEGMAPDSPLRAED